MFTLATDVQKVIMEFLKNKYLNLIFINAQSGVRTHADNSLMRLKRIALNHSAICAYCGFHVCFV